MLRKDLKVTKDGRFYRENLYGRLYYIETFCETCGIICYQQSPKFKKGHHHFCGHSCAGKSSYVTHSNKGKFGKDAHRWKGGKKLHNQGYILVYSKGHPNANNHGYMMEHRLVMEKHLGRYLTKEERVHHKNGIKNDNRVENLQLFKNRSEHITYHRKLDKRRKVKC